MTTFVGYISPNISPKKDKEDGSLQFVSLERTRLKLEKASDRIRELEENLQGKQVALDELAAENVTLKTKPQTSQDGNGSTRSERDALLQQPLQQPPDQDAYKHKLDEYDKVLKAKDGVIEQLTEALQASNEEKEEAQKESMAQATQLADEIHRLQQRLKQSSELLDHQLGIPVQALLEAKNEILALQNSLDIKDTEVESMAEAIRQRDTALTQLAEKYQTVSQQLSTMTEQSASLKQLGEEREHWHVTQQHWTASEQHLKEENAKYLAEMQSLRDSFQQKDQSFKELHASMSTASNEKSSRISELEISIDSYEKEISALKDHISVRENELLQEVSSLKDVISIKDSTIYDFERQLAELNKACAEKDANVSHLESQLHIRDEEILSLKDNLSSSKREIDHLLTENGKLSDANGSLSDEIKQLKDALLEKESCLQDFISQSESTTEQRDLKVVMLEKSCCEYREEINQHMDDLSLKSKEINELSQLYDRVRDECAKYVEENRALQATICQKDTALEQLEKHLSDTTQEKDHRLSHLNSKISESSCQITQLNEKIISYEREIEKLTHMKDTIDSDRSKCVEEISDLKTVVTEVNSTYESLKLQFEESKLDFENRVSKLQRECISLQQTVSSLQESKIVDGESLEEMKERLSQHKSEIANLNGALSNKEETVLALQNEMGKKTEVVTNLEYSLSRKCEELSQLRDVLSSKESGVSEVTALLSEKEEQLQVIEQQIKVKDAEICSKSQDVSEKEKRLQEMETELQKKEYELQQALTSLAVIESDFNDLNKKLHDNGQQMQNLTAEREQQENTIKSLLAEIAKKESTCSNFQQEIKENTEKFAELQVHVAERNAACRSLKDELLHKEIALSDMTQSLEQKQRSILDLETSLDDATKLNQQMSAVNEKVLLLEKVLDDKETILKDLRFKLSDLSGQNADLENENKSLKERVNFLVQVEERLAQVQNELIQMQNEVSKLQEENANKNVALKELNDTVESLNLQINNLQSENTLIMEEKQNLEKSLCHTRDELQRSSERLQSEKDELQNVISLSQKDYDSIAESLAAVQAEKQRLIDQMEKVQFDKLELAQSTEMLLSEKDDLLNKQDEMNSQLSDQSNASDTLAFEMDELLVRIEGLEIENNVLLEKKSELDQELNVKQSAMVALQEQVSTLQAQSQITSDHQTALQKTYDDKCEELATIHSSLHEKTQALNELEASMETKLATSVQEAVENATQNYVQQIEKLTREIKDLKNRENEKTCVQESLEQKVARLSDSWTVVEGVEAKHQAIDKVMLESGTSLGSSQSAESASSMECGSDERKVLSPVMRGTLQASTSSSSSAQEGRLHELESEVARLQEILHAKERTVLDSTKDATQQMKKRNEQIKSLNEKAEKQAAQIKAMKERGTVLKNDFESLKTKYAALQSQLKARGAKVTIPQKLESAIKEKVAENNSLKEQIELRDADILTLNKELQKKLGEPLSSSPQAGTSEHKAESPRNGDLSSEIQRIREENTVLVEKLQLITDEHDSAYRSVKVENSLLSEKLSEERRIFEKEKATFEEEKRRWEVNIRSLSGRHQELYQQTATSNLDILTQLERLKAENAQFKSQVDELSTKLAIHASRNDETMKLKQEMTNLSRNHELLKMEQQTARATLHELESRNPEVLVYRKKLDDLHATLQVTWIENEELKAQVMQLKYQLGLEADDESMEPSTGASGQDSQSRVQRQIQQLKTEHASQIEKISCELETVKAKAKEIEIEKDSLHTKYQQEMRVKEKEHLNVLNELTRQLDHTRSVLDSLRSEYRHSQQEIQKLEDEKEAMQKSYGRAVEAMRREHQDTLNRVRAQAERSAKTVMVPLKENASADTMQVRARLNLLMDEKIKLSKERDQLISERQDLILERELMLAEKMQLVADKDKLSAENAQLKGISDGKRKEETVGSEYERNLKTLKEKHDEELHALQDNLNDGHRAEVLLLKKTIITVLHEEIRKQIECSTQIIHHVLGKSSHPDVIRAHQILQAQLIDQLDNMKIHLTEHGVLSIQGDDSASDMQRMVRYLQQQNQELAEAKETLLERSDVQTPHDGSFGELSDQDSLDLMQRSQEHDGFVDHADSISMHDSLEDYSEADFRAQIDVLQRENADLRRRIEGDYHNLNVVHSLKKEIVGLQAKYVSVMQRNATHMRDIDSASQDDDSESLVTPPQRGVIEPGVDWKRKYDDLMKETQMLRGRIDALTLSHQLSTKSVSVENLRARYETIMEENEILRAKLGSYGLPTEGTPEEDSFDLQAKFEAVMKENENLRTKLDNYSMSSSSSLQRDEDWKSKFDGVLEDLDLMKQKCLSSMDVSKAEGDVKQSLYELQGFYDIVAKEKEIVAVKLESVQDNAEKEFASLHSRYKQLLQKHHEIREKWKRTIEKSRKERSKLKARFVAALKEINILKQKADRVSKADAEDITSDNSATDVKQPLDHEKKQLIDSLKNKITALQNENSAMKSEIGNLKSKAIGGLRRQLREAPQSTDDISEDMYESLQDKYTSACREIEYLRSQLDAIQGKMIDDLNSEVNDDHADFKPLHSQLAYLKAAGVGDSISESADFMSTDPHDSDSDTSGDSLDLEMETDYEVLVQEYERLRSQGPAEIQLEYEAVLRRLNLQDVFSSPKRRTRNITDSKDCKSDPISSEAQITKGSSSSIVSQRSRQQQQLEGLTLPGDISPDQAIDKESQPVSYVPCKIPSSSPSRVLPLLTKQKKSPGETSTSSMLEISEIEDWEVSGYSDGFDFLDSQEESLPQEQENSRCSEVSSELEEILNRFDWSITENEELVTYIEELARLINDPRVRETITRELVELCRKCCTLVQDNESLRRELMEANMNRVKNASHESSPKTPSSVDKISMSRFVEIEHKLSQSNDKLKRELKETKNVIEILRLENENLMRENARLASTYQSTTAKASWEISLMKTSYEDEIEELKCLHDQLSGEASKLKDVYIEVKVQNETLTTDNEDLSNAVCKLRSDLEQVRSSCADLINERDLLVLEVQQKNCMISDLQGKGLGRTCGDGNTSSEGSSSGHQENNHGSPSTNGQPSNGGHLSPGSSRGSSNGSGGFSPGGGSDNEGDDDTFKTLEELRKEVRQLRRKLRAKCNEIQQLQSFQRTYQTLVAENQELKLQLSDKSQEAQNLKGRNKLLLNQSKSLDEKVTEAAVKSKQESDDLKKKMFILESENRNLIDKIDKDVFKAEKEVAQLRQKYSVILQEKEALEFEYRTTSEGLEKELSNLQTRYDEISNENEMMKAKFGQERSHAENEMFQAQVCVQDMAMDHETSQAEFQRGRDKIHKEIDDLKSKAKRLKEEKKLMYHKYEDQIAEYENVKIELQKACDKFEEDNILLQTEVNELGTKYDYECKSREDVSKQLEELSNNYSALERVLEDVKSEMTQEIEQLKNRMNETDRECEIMSKSNEELKSRKSTLAKDLQDSQAWCELLEKSLKELESNLGEENILLKENATTAQTQLENERKCLGEMQAERDELRLQYESLCRKYNLLQATHDTTTQKDNNSEVEYFRYEFNELQKKYENLVRERNNQSESEKQMAVELDNVKESLVCQEEQTGSMSGEIEILRTQITRQEDRISQLTQSREELIREREKLSHSLKEAQNKNKHREKEMEENQKKIKTEFNVRNERLDKVHNDYTVLTQEYEKYRSNMAIIERDYKILLDKFTMLESKNLDFEQVTHELAVAKQRSRELEGYIDNLHQDKEILINEKDEFKKEKDQFKYENESLREERDQAVMSKVALSSELEGMMARLQDVDSEKKQLAHKVQELQAAFDVVDDESDRQILEDRVQDYAKSEELRNLREQYKEMQRSHGELEVTREEMTQQLEDIQSRHHALQDLFDRTKQQFAGEEQALRDEIESLKMRVTDRTNLVNAQTSPLSSHVSPESSQDGYDSESLRDEIEVLKRKLEHLESVLLTYQRLQGLPQQVWRKEFLNIQHRYLSMLQEHHIMQRKLGRMERIHEKMMTDKSVSPLAVNDELIADNNRLINEKLQLEIELQTLKLDRQELEMTQLELGKMQEIKTDLEARLEGQKIVFAQDRDRLQKKIAKLQSIIDENSSCRNELEKELASVNHKYKNLISFKMDDVREFSESMNDRSQMLARLQASSTELRDLERHHRQILTDYEALKAQLEKITKENEQNRKHNRELRDEVARLTTKTEELTKEYHEAARCLAETNLELEIYRSKHRRDVYKIEDVMKRLKGNLGCGTLSPHSILSQTLFGRLSPNLGGSGHSTPRSSHESHGSSCSLTFDDEGSLKFANDDVLESRHFQTVEEIGHLRSELRTRSLSPRGSYSDLESLTGNRRYTRSPLPFSESEREQQQQQDSHNEFRSIQEEMSVIRDRNHQLLEERDDLVVRLREQEDIVMHLQKQLKSRDPSENRLVELFNHQLMMLRQQRDHLMHRLEEDRERDRRVIELIREKGAIENRYRQERDELRKKLHEKETLTREQRNRISQMEKYIRKQQQLEDLLAQKEQLENELTRQAFHYESEMSDIQKGIAERRTLLRPDGSLSGISASPTSPRVQFVPSPTVPEQSFFPSASYALAYEYPRPSAVHSNRLNDQQTQRLSRMKSVVERRYKHAIEKLREELKQDSRRYDISH